MTGKQHLTFGTITGTAFTFFLWKEGICLDKEFACLTIGGSMLGSLIPDIDKPNSMISNILGPFSKAISLLFNKLFGHRGFIHYFVLWAILGYFAINKNLIFLGLFFGIFGHLFLDAFTTEGIPGLLWIFNRKYIHSPKKWKLYVGSTKTQFICFFMNLLISSNLILLPYFLQEII